MLRWAIDGGVVAWESQRQLLWCRNKRRLVRRMERKGAVLIGVFVLSAGQTEQELHGRIVEELEGVGLL